MSNSNGLFVWYDLMTSDPEAAVRFYTKAVDWGTDVWPGPEPYTMWTADGVPIGGVVKQKNDKESQGGPPHWLAYVGVDDINATVAKVKELGGQVHFGPQEIPEMGSYAIIADPQGAVFGVYQSSSNASMPGEPTRGKFSWNELTASDHEAAFDFYSKLFGWEKTTSMDMGAMGVYQMYGKGGTTFGGMFNRTPEMPMPNWLPYVMVDDVKETAERITGLGGKVVNGPMDVPGGMIVQCADPQGAMFAAHAHVEGETPPV